MAQLRAIKTSLGGQLPVYKLNLGRSQLRADGVAVYSFHEESGGFETPLYPEPILSELRTIMTDAYIHGNNVALANITGTGYFLNKDGTPDTRTEFTATNGEFTTEEDEYGIFTVKTMGSVTGYWIGNKVARREPIPNAYIPVMTDISSPRITIEDFNGNMFMMTFNTYFNVYGITNVHVETYNVPMGSQYYSGDLDYEVLKDYDEEPGGEGIMARYSPRVSTSSVGLYVADKTELSKFMDDVWTTTAIESINKAFIGDGSNALTGITWYYGLRTSINKAEQRNYISLGNIPYRDSGLFNVLGHEFCNYDFGSVNVTPTYNDYRDYTLCKYSVYIPFLGEFVDLNADDVVGKTLYLKYTINMSDGSAICYLSTDNSQGNTKGLLFSSACQWGYDIPFSAESLKTAGSWMMGSMLAIASTVTKLPLPAGSFDGRSGSSYSTGGGSGNNGVISDMVPKLIIYKKEDLTGSAHITSSGRPSADTVTVGSCTGYLQVSNVYNAGSLAFRGADKIIAQLKEGIYI